MRLRAYLAEPVRVDGHRLFTTIWYYDADDLGNGDVGISSPPAADKVLHAKGLPIVKGTSQQDWVAAIRAEGSQWLELNTQATGLNTQFPVGTTLAV